MEFKYSPILVILTILVAFREGTCLECYSCTSQMEPKCGKTWELSGEDAAQYLVSCEGEYTACKKIDTNDVLNGMELVTRSCWNASDVELGDNFYECKDIGGSGTACYCNDDKDGIPCNGQQPMLTYKTLFALLISASMLVVLHKM